MRTEGPDISVKGVHLMTSRRLLWVCLIGAFCCVALVGCGGEAAIVKIKMVGVYDGSVTGDGAGPLRFYIGRNGQLTGNVRIPPLCAGPIKVTGTVTRDGNVTWTATGCGITFQGTGKVERLAPGSNVYVGSGTWTGSDGSGGTWGATWVARTGSIGV